MLAHGFTQTARSWSTVEATVTARRSAADIIAVDLPGHGTASDVRGDLWAAADLLTERGSSGTYVGYSMGGRVALHAALAHPDVVQRLVLIGATAGIDDEIERAQRRENDELLASRIERIGVGPFVDEWLDNPLFAGLTAATAMRADRLANSASGLASSLRLAGTGTQEPLWARLDEVRCPTLILVGQRDAKFRELGERLVAGLADASMRVIADSGHSVHLEQPDATADAVLDFVDRTPLG